MDRLLLGDRHPVTGAQVRGPVWRGRLPRRPHRTVPQPLSEKELGFGVVPGSPLASLLARLKRSERRALLAAVQSTNPARRRRLERSLRGRLEQLGIVP